MIRSEGSSRAWINGRPVTLTQLKTLAAGLIEIHGQHEHQALLDRAQQLALLDAFGEHAAELAEVTRLAHGLARNRHAHRRAFARRRSRRTHRMAESSGRRTRSPCARAGRPRRAGRTAPPPRQFRPAAAGLRALAERLDGDSEFALLRRVTRDPGGDRAPGRDSIRAWRRSANWSMRRRSSSAKPATRWRATRAQPRSRSGTPRRSEAQLGKLHELARKHRVRMPELKAHADETARGTRKHCAVPARASQPCAANSNASRSSLRDRGADARASSARAPASGSAHRSAR